MSLQTPIDPSAEKTSSGDEEGFREKKRYSLLSENVSSGKAASEGIRKINDNSMQKVIRAGRQLGRKNFLLLNAKTKEIDENLKLGERLGITGTPAIIFPDGKHRPRAMAAEALISRIDRKP